MNAFMWVMLGFVVITGAMRIGDWLRDHRPVAIAIPTRAVDCR
ncbi:MAG: hypothetical protein QM747_19780 [Nocardioides sp.]